MECFYKPYIDYEFESSLINRLHPPRVCIDNDTREDCTVVKVDSANKHGIVLEMVQVLTDLDLIISKCYISSDGAWSMDVFHVTDQLGKKLTDENLICYIQEALCAERKERGLAKDVQTCLDRLVVSKYVSTEHTTLEMTTIDRPGLLSEISAVLTELGCQIVAAEAWTHNGLAACIINVEDESRGGGPITDRERLAYVEEQLENVVQAHKENGERKRVMLAAPVGGTTHTERRLHQLMVAERDYERGCEVDGDDVRSSGKTDCCGRRTQVSIENCNEKRYSLVTVRSKDRPKLLFDTVCTITDLKYEIFHATITSKDSMAVQEYYVRHMNGSTIDMERERQRVNECLVAAVERGVFQGLRLDVCTRNRVGLLSDITRVFRENGLSVTRTEIGTHGEEAIGSFYVTDASGNDVDSETVEVVRNEIGGTILKVNKFPGRVSPLSHSDKTMVVKPRFRLDSLLSYMTCLFMK